jgi:D-glycero-D-manno-heptose 1,7-bisphosphate phosphatase
MKRRRPGAAKAARRSKEAGFLLVVVTNQPDVAAGRTPKATMGAMHAEIRRLMPTIAHAASPNPG